MKVLVMWLPALFLGALLGFEGVRLANDAKTDLRNETGDITVERANVNVTTDFMEKSATGAMYSNAVVQDPFIGTIVMFGGNFAPTGWAFCDGQLLLISQNQALFSILGTTYGGDGEMTFGLPDLRQRAAVHEGNGPGIPGSYSLGEIGGSHDVTLTINQIPAHSHVVKPNAKVGAGDETNPTNGFPSTTSTDFYAETANTQLGATTSENTGGGQSHYNVPPYQAVNYIIALFGVFPSEN